MMCKLKGRIREGIMMWGFYYVQIKRVDGGRALYGNQRLDGKGFIMMCKLKGE